MDVLPDAEALVCRGDALKRLDLERASSGQVSSIDPRVAIGFWPKFP
jgi:hypothetical protein